MLLRVGYLLQIITITFNFKSLSEARTVHFYLSLLVIAIPVFLSFTPLPSSFLMSPPYHLLLLPPLLSPASPLLTSLLPRPCPPLHSHSPLLPMTKTRRRRRRKWVKTTSLARWKARCHFRRSGSHHHHVDQEKRRDGRQLLLDFPALLLPPFHPPHASVCVPSDPSPSPSPSLSFAYCCCHRCCSSSSSPSASYFFCRRRPSSSASSCLSSTPF